MLSTVGRQASHQEKLAGLPPPSTVWVISGSATRTARFKKELRSCSWSHQDKSSRTYDSLFEKWVSWCSGQDSDPVSGSIGEVINFQAYLYQNQE